VANIINNFSENSRKSEKKMELSVLNTVSKKMVSKG
jgi:hypothetical protein